VEDLDAIRERLQILKEELTSIMNDRLNKNMYILSVITALFLPLGFLTGLFGVNLAGMPGAANSAAFIGFVVALVLIGALQLLIFRWLRWF
ncbi:MAG: zinc transporter ZntB, partial [Rhodobacteraceae bacterium]|nr:zinc transporter ZntB [Paracoccaceae bacterium]